MREHGYITDQSYWKRAAITQINAQQQEMCEQYPIRELGRNIFEY